MAHVANAVLGVASPSLRASLSNNRNVFRGAHHSVFLFALMIWPDTLDPNLWMEFFYDENFSWETRTFYSPETTILDVNLYFVLLKNFSFNQNF